MEDKSEENKGNEDKQKGWKQNNNELKWNKT